MKIKTIENLEDALSDLESNIVLGLLVSFLAWSITELYTLCLSIEIQYKNEENYF